MPEKKIDGHTISHLFRVAENAVEKKTAFSIVLDEDAEAAIPRFDFSELTLGRVLGRGGFCVVNEISNIKLNKKHSSHSTPNGIKGGAGDDEHHFFNIVQDRSFMEEHCIRNKKDCRYAIKKVQESAQKDSHTFVSGIVDLAIEARFLSVIRHPNIIKMRAMGSGSRYNLDFFVVLDRLYDTMTVRIGKWKKQRPTGMKKFMDRSGKKALAFWIERVTVAYDLSCAVKYLHDLNVVYRDIKPDNIGFDVRGDVKIFDFGLAKEIDPEKRENGTYKLTGDTGSPRYMAPEVALSKPYNETCDVYSFCILLWQILEMESPFEGFTMNMFKKKVVNGGARPICNPKWPNPIVQMMKEGWSDTIEVRPSMEEVQSVLREEINNNTDEEICEIMDASRKSALSLHGENRGDF